MTKPTTIDIEVPGGTSISTLAETLLEVLDDLDEEGADPNSFSLMFLRQNEKGNLVLRYLQTVLSEEDLALLVQDPPPVVP